MSVLAVNYRIERQYYVRKMIVGFFGLNTMAVP